MIDPTCIDDRVRYFETVPDAIQRDCDAKRGCLGQVLVFALVGFCGFASVASLMLLSLSAGLSTGSWLGSLIVLVVSCGMVYFAFAARPKTALRPPSGYPTVTLIDKSLRAENLKYQVDVSLAKCRVREGCATSVKFFCRKSRGAVISVRIPVLLIDLPPFGFGPFGQLESYTTVAVGYTNATRQAWTKALEEQLGAIPYTPNTPAVTESDAGASVKVREHQHQQEAAAGRSVLP